LAGATKAEQRPLAPYYSPVAQRRAKSLAKGGGGTAGGAPSGGSALHCNCRAFVRGLAGQTGAGVQGCEAPAKTLTGTVGRVSVRWLPGGVFKAQAAATAHRYTRR